MVNVKSHFSWIRKTLRSLKRRFATSHPNHDYHHFHRDFKQNEKTRLQNFSKGKHQFLPMRGYNHDGKIEPMWSFLDSFLIKLLFRHIKPTFKHLISKHCYHLQGPSSIPAITRHIQQALEHHAFRYVIRIDIKSYYASIDREILSEQVQQTFDDPLVKKYLDDIIHNTIDRGGWIETPGKGIPRRSSLSSFFAALYLKSLDQAFEEKTGVLYIRYNDDVLILCETKRQFVKAKQTLRCVLTSLKLQLSPTKTRMGKLHQGFHFLGVDYQVARTPESGQCSATTVNVKLHPRCCYRAIDRLISKRAGAGSPAEAQLYLKRWSRWWSNVHPQIHYTANLKAWVDLSMHVRGAWTARFGIEILFNVYSSISL